MIIVVGHVLCVGHLCEQSVDSIFCRERRKKKEEKRREREEENDGKARKKRKE